MNDYLIKLCILYLLNDKSECIPINTDNTRFEFVDNLLVEMHADELIEINNDYWMLSNQGKKFLEKQCEEYNKFLEFEIFSNVNLKTETLPEAVSPDGFTIYDNVSDPRFDSFGCGDDLRIAILQFYNQKIARSKNEQININKMIFIQLLIDDNLNEDKETFLFDLKLGIVFDEIDKTIKNAYQLSDFDKHEDDCLDIAQNIYSAGIIERNKRE